MIAEMVPQDIEDAALRLAGHVRRTPVLDLGHTLSDDFTLILKLEQLQVTGSFKARGAFSVLIATELPAAGVVAASGGNFGIAVAYAASRLATMATIFVPGSSPPEKTGRIAEHGADVRIVPGYYDDAHEAAQDFVSTSGAFEAHAYDQHEVMAGQGTLAFELESQTPFDVILSAVGGGGLIGGIASWLQDRATVVGVEPEHCRCFNAALTAGRPVEVEVSGVAASSLGSRVFGELPWTARRWIDESVLVSDEDIIEAQRWIWAQTRLAVEPAAAATIAALRTGAFQPDRGARVVAVLSGGNVDPATVV